MAGATVANRFRRRVGFGRTVLMTTFFAAVCPLLLLSRAARVASIALVVVEAVYGFNVLVFNVNTITLRQIITPNRLLGRMNASYRMVLFGTGPIGAVLGGWLGAGRPATALVIAARAGDAGPVDVLLPDLPDAGHADRRRRRRPAASHAPAPAQC